MRKHIIEKLRELREGALYAAMYMRDKGAGEPVQDMINYISELEAQMSGADSDFYTEVATQRATGVSVTVKKGLVQVNGKEVDGIRVEIGNDLGLGPTEAMRLVAEQLQKEINDRESKEAREAIAKTEDEPSEGDKAKNTGDIGTANGEPTNTKKVGEPTIH